MKLGPLAGSYCNAVPPQVQIIVAGQSGAVIQNTSLCGWQSTSICLAQGVGDVSGQKVSSQFTYNGGSPYININIVWPYRATDAPVMLDDLEIVPG